MPLFAYRAATHDGRMVSGQADAADLPGLEDRLLELKLDLISARKIGLLEGLKPARKVARRELVAFCFHLEQLCRAGVPLLEGLCDLRDSTTHEALAATLAGLIAAIQGGRSLSEAMENFPAVFDPVFIQLVRAGEASGQLGEVFERLGETLRNEDERSARLRLALTYPAFIAALSGAAMGFLLIYLVPQLRQFVQNLGESLPFHTRLLFAVSEFCMTWWLPALATLALLAGSLQLGIRSNPRLRRLVDALKLKLPFIGDTLHKTLLARFADTFALLYAAGIPVLDALRMTEGVVGNRELRSRLERAGRMIGEGQQISTAFQAGGVFPPLLIRMLHVGESTGELDKALRQLAYFYGREVHEAVARMEKLAEPVLTLVLGLLLGWIMLSVLGPIYDIVSSTRI